MTISVFVTLIAVGAFVLAVAIVLTVWSWWTDPRDADAVSTAPVYKSNVFAPGPPSTGQPRVSAGVSPKAWVTAAAWGVLLAGIWGLTAVVLRFSPPFQTLFAVAGALAGSIGSYSVMQSWQVLRARRTMTVRGAGAVDLRKTVGQVAVVTATIPDGFNQAGRVLVDLDRGQVEVTAYSDSGHRIETRTRVRVMRIGDVGSVVVSVLPDAPPSWDGSFSLADSVR